MTRNPYEPAVASSLQANAQTANRRLWAVVGFVITFTPLAALGAYGLYADAQYAATLPPNTPRCGNGAMGAMLLIVPVSPILGCIGAAIGFISAIIYNAAISCPAISEPQDGG